MLLLEVEEEEYKSCMLCTQKYDKNYSYKCFKLLKNPSEKLQLMSQCASYGEACHLLFVCSRITGISFFVANFLNSYYYCILLQISILLNEWTTFLQILCVRVLMGFFWILVQNTSHLLKKRQRISNYNSFFWFILHFWDGQKFTFLTATWKLWYQHQSTMTLHTWIFVVYLFFVFHSLFHPGGNATIKVVTSRFV